MSRPDTPRLAALSQAGVSIWLDDLSRDRLRTGDLAALVRDRCVVGVTTNPTIFAAALADGTAYAGQLRELAARGADVDTAIRELTVADVQAACDVLGEVHLATNGTDGRVSLEVDPTLAHDADATVAQAMELWKAVDRPNLMVKIPATRAGLPAIAQVLGEGISVNVTLIFSVQRYRAVVDAYAEGMERALANGHRLDRIASVASFFVSRVDTEIDQRLETIGTEAARALRGRAGVANARLAYAAYRQVCATDRWTALRAEGARPQRLLWASTGVKNPAYPDTLYVSELVAAGTVNTMPEQTLHAFADHGEVHGDRLTGTAEAARRVFAGLEAAGVDLTEVFDTLERDGVAKFLTSWTQLEQTVRARLDAARAPADAPGGGEEATDE
ncbi:transaldolase [Pseudonocardia hispaniensis]|uniref:Transaldolase n=1 Tax=Pseudonocardia hispaniensis TaxID=904933 RepID=A0ABW1J1M8_9PSEU